MCQSIDKIDIKIGISRSKHAGKQMNAFNTRNGHIYNCQFWRQNGNSSVAIETLFIQMRKKWNEMEKRIWLVEFSFFDLQKKLNLFQTIYHAWVHECQCVIMNRRSFLIIMFNFLLVLLLPNIYYNSFLSSHYCSSLLSSYSSFKFSHSEQNNNNN